MDRWNECWRKGSKFKLKIIFLAIGDREQANFISVIITFCNILNFTRIKYTLLYRIKNK